MKRWCWIVDDHSRGLFKQRGGGGSKRGSRPLPGVERWKERVTRCLMERKMRESMYSTYSWRSQDSRCFKGRQTKTNQHFQGFCRRSGIRSPLMERPWFMCEVFIFQADFLGANSCGAMIHFTVTMLHFSLRRRRQLTGSQPSLTQKTGRGGFWAAQSSTTHTQKDLA